MLKTSDKLPQQHSTTFRGLPVIVQWPAGSIRTGTNPDGTPFKTEMKGASYGYIPHTTGKDEESINVYIGPNEDSEYAYIVEQLDETGEFEEYKIMLGWDTLKQAEEAYTAHAGEDLLGSISEVEFDYLFDVVREKQKEAAEKKETAKTGCTHTKSGEWCGRREIKTAAAGEKYTVVEAFLKNYRHEVDFYEEVATLTQEKLDQALQDAGIKAVVSSRAKSPERLERKLYKRDKQKHYQTFREIYDDVIDLAGCRVALYLPADRAAVGEIIDKLFVAIRSPKSFPESSKPEEGDSLGYVATHYLVILRPETLRKKELRYADTQIEIQVASILMHAWAEICHDLVYKPEKGSLTSEEQKALQNLNVLVQEGERQLEELQASMESRDGTSLRFDVTAALAQNLKERSKGKVAYLTVGAFKNALDAIATPVTRAEFDRLVDHVNREIGVAKDVPLHERVDKPTQSSTWTSYVQAAETLRKARWQKQDVVSPETRKKWEATGTLGDETHYIYEAMAKLAPGKQISTLWVQPNRNEIIALAQQLKTEAQKKI